MMQSEQSLNVALEVEDPAQRDRLADALRADGITVRPSDPREPADNHRSADAVIVAHDLSDDSGVVPSIPEFTGPLGSLPVVLVAAGGNRRAQRAAMDEGIAAIVVDTDVEQTLAPTVRAVCVGQIVVPRALRWQFETPALSQREKQVLSLVVMGFTNGEIARKLYLAESTVKSHLSSSFGKLGVRSRREAADVIVDAHNGLGTGILAITDGARL
jgi:DNA-binding NarL/FixJ family response regulator